MDDMPSEKAAGEIKRPVVDTETLSNAIVDRITYMGCIGGVELAVWIAASFDYSGDQVTLMYDLAKQGRYLELEYVTPGNHRVKSLFFAAGTEFRLQGQSWTS